MITYTREKTEENGKEGGAAAANSDLVSAT
jgi:hypothetical protein